MCCKENEFPREPVSVRCIGAALGQGLSAQKELGFNLGSVITRCVDTGPSSSLQDADENSYFQRLR